jgi:hypothetical protein
VYSSYSWIRGDFDRAVTTSELGNIGNQLEIFLKKISPESRTYFLQASEYFPHVTTKSLQNGFYKKFDRIQGRGGLFYATTLLSFETMNMALYMSQEFVTRYLL